MTDSISKIVNDHKPTERSEALNHESESRSPEPSTTRLSSLELALEAIRVAIEQRSLDPIGIALGKESSIADYYIIGSGTSPRHVKGICDRIKNALILHGERPLSENGYENAEWVILDYGDVIIHVFYEPTRQYYRLEEMLSGSPRLELGGELAAEAKKLRTGIIP